MFRRLRFTPSVFADAFIKEMAQKGFRSRSFALLMGIFFVLWMILNITTSENVQLALYSPKLIASALLGNELDLTSKCQLMKKNHYFCIGTSDICGPMDEYTSRGKPNDGELCRKLNEMGSDKCSRHNYPDYYHYFFKKISNRKLNILEIGLGSQVDPRFKSQMKKNFTIGGSQRVWRDYFTNSQIFGADVNPDIIFEEERLKTFHVDITKNETLNAMFDKIGVQLDILIDDSLHEPGPQENLLSVAFEKIKPGGFYIVEDVSSETFCDKALQSYLRRGFKSFAFIRTNKIYDSVLSIIKKP
ncbi:uncharacterized protein LOC134857121 [Symsagittifera roscoffensis]|uniref:uncharacterized protein LOC134857121 n=1 Tax=Symsagittifera roscoffensis TaxID=84072 RepID=UPI00307B9C46